MDFRFDIISEYMPYFLKGALVTIETSLIGVVVGTILGLFIGLGKLSSNKIVRLPFIWYINIFRGTPLLVQLFIIHFGVMPLFFSRVDAVTSLVVALSVNSAAYVAEIFRAGIQSIDKGQMEAARSLGMTRAQAMRHIIIPQAVKRMIPPLGNEFIALLKDSSLGAVIAAPDLMYYGRAATGEYYRVWEPYLTVAVIYFILTFVLTYIIQFVESRLNKG